MPIEATFSYTDLVMFHNIYYDRSVVKLLSYIVLMTGTDGAGLGLTPDPQRDITKVNPLVYLTSMQGGIIVLTVCP